MRRRLVWVEKDGSFTAAGAGGEFLVFLDLTDDGREGYRARFVSADGRATNFGLHVFVEAAQDECQWKYDEAVQAAELPKAGSRKSRPRASRETDK